ncbi:hypothetical protein JCM10213v2_004092 [Rhodosporidiobolus nylandii]
MVDPRFTFPMRRGGINGSSSGSGQGRAIGLGLNGPAEEQRETDRARDSTNGLSFVASLGSRPLVDNYGRPLPSFQSYASPIASPNTASSDASPSLPLFSPAQPFSPTSPITSSYPSPETPATSTLATAFSPSTSFAKPKPKPKRRGTFTARRRKPSIHASSPRRRSRRHSAASSSSSTRANSGGFRTRTSSLPNLRAAASSPPRRPSIPFDTFEPRGARTRSPGQERTSRESFSRGRTPIIFPSKGSPATPRALATPQRPPLPPRSGSQAPGHARETSRNVVASGVCEAFTFAHPRVVVVSGSPMSSIEGETPELVREDQDGVRRPSADAGAQEKGKAVLRDGPLSDAEVDELLSDPFDQSSVRRVLRENEASRAERAAWSDSATKALGFGLSVRMADRERARRDGAKSAAQQLRKQEVKRVREDVARRKRQQAGADSETEGDTARSRRFRSGSSRVPGDAGPHPSPPMPTSFQPFTSIGRKLSFKRRSRSRDRRASETGAVSDGFGLGIYHAMRKKRSGSDVRRPSADSATAAGSAVEPTTPRTATVRGQPIRHLRASNSVDSLYERANGAPGVAGRTLVYDEPVAVQIGEAVSPPPDQASPAQGERRRPSVQAQNAFLSLPPHLHHLLRSPERTRFTPSRPPPPIPTFLLSPSADQLQQVHDKRTLVASPSLPVLSERDSHRLSSSSSASAARLSLALEEHLRQDQPSTAKDLGALPIAGKPPLVWRSREASSNALSATSGPSGPPPTSTRSLAASRSEPALSAFAAPQAGDDRASSTAASPARHDTSISSWMETAEDPLRTPEGRSAADGQHSSPHLSPPLSVRPFAPRRSTSGSSPREGRHSRASSGSSALRMEVDRSYDNLFFSPPRRQRPSFQSPSFPPSPDTSAAADASAPRPEAAFRIGDVPVSPVDVRRRPSSMASYEASPAEVEDGELAYDAEYEARRLRTTQKSLEAIFALPSTSVETVPSAYLTAAEPSSYGTAPSFLSSSPVVAAGGPSLTSRPATAQSTTYATADEGESTELETSDLPEIVFPGDSPASQALVLPYVPTRPRPRPTPAQTPWASTSFAREYLGSFEAEPVASQPPAPMPSPPVMGKRVSAASGSGSGQSFLQLDEDTEHERVLPSPSSFIDDFSPPSSAPNSPTALFPPSLPQSPSSDSSAPVFEPDNRASYLSVSSAHFISPTHRTSGYSAGSGSRYSGMSDLNAFPTPPRAPVVQDDASASDGDDEAEEEDEDDEAEEEDEDEAMDPNATIRFPSVVVEEDNRTLRRLPSIRSFASHAPAHSPSRSSLSLDTSEYTIESTADDEELGVRRLAFARLPDLAALPTTEDRPVSSQSYLDLSDSAGSGRETLAGGPSAKATVDARRSSGSSWRSFFSNEGAADSQQRRPALAGRRRHSRASSTQSWWEGPEETRMR